jgi:hypothetical protein
MVSVDELRAQISLWRGYYIYIKCVYLMAGCSEPWHLVHCSEYPCFCLIALLPKDTRNMTSLTEPRQYIFSSEHLGLSAPVINQLCKLSAPVPSVLLSIRMTLSSTYQRDCRTEELTLARRETKVCSEHAGNNTFIKNFDRETKQRDR